MLLTEFEKLSKKEISREDVAYLISNLKQNNELINIANNVHGGCDFDEVHRIEQLVIMLNKANKLNLAKDDKEVKVPDVVSIDEGGSGFNISVMPLKLLILQGKKDVALSKA